MGGGGGVGRTEGQTEGRTEGRNDGKPKTMSFRFSSKRRGTKTNTAHSVYDITAGNHVIRNVYDMCKL